MKVTCKISREKIDLPCPYTGCPNSEKCEELYALLHERSTLVEGCSMTNADRIRAMTDEELAKAFDYEFEACPPDVDRDKWCASDDDCKLCWLDWLRQPYGGAK